MKIFCIGRNYVDHAKELNNEVPTEPVVFLKPKSALLQSGVPFYYPEFTNELHYEAELVLRVAKNGRYVQQRHAQKYYNAITVGIDFTARDIQNELKKKGLPWEKAKAWDSSAVIGSWFNFTPEMAKNGIDFQLDVNGETRQVGHSSDMIFHFNELVENITQYFSINIGDLIFTGTPAGVGEVVVGDILEGYLEQEKAFRLEIK